MSSVSKGTLELRFKHHAVEEQSVDRVLLRLDPSIIEDNQKYKGNLA